MIRPLLHERFPELRSTLPFLRLGMAPTPVWEARALNVGVAPVWVKDDSVFGDGRWGGNKVRKLEWLLPDLLRRRKTSLVTVGAVGTNWGLAAAVYAAELGLRTTLVLVDQPEDEHVRAQIARLKASGARLRFAHGRTRATAWVVASVAGGLGRRAFLPVGGSSALGVLGYVEAALELGAQVAAGELPEPSHLVVPIGSGGTAAGLALGLRLAGLRTRVVGVLVNDRTSVDTAELASRAVRELARRGANLPADLLAATESARRGANLPGDLLAPKDSAQRGGKLPGDLAAATESARSGASPPVSSSDHGLALEIVRDWLGAGYGHPIPEGEKATEAAMRAGLILEPVYTAKAVAGLLALNAAGHFGAGPVVYLHTYGPRPA